MSEAILALDQGTTSSRAIVFGRDGQPLSMSQQEFPQHMPAPGLVEHDAEDIWATQLQVAQQALAKAEIPASRVAGIGITNQRETTILWDRETGRPLANAIVWQSRASETICERLKADGLESVFHEKTGLLLDPYFSGTKIRYLLDRDSELQARAERGEVLFGTVDSFLIWRLTGGKIHAPDISNASRTLLFNIHSREWDDALLKLLNIPHAMLPEVRSSSEVYGETSSELFGAAIPISGAAGDQQAATFGQACFEPGNVKNTYGTGCFMLMNTGSEAKASQNNLLTTIGWQIGSEVTYCLEGSVFIGGAVVQWLRDGLGIIKSSSEVESLAASVPDAGGISLVPAFVGLGAPYWDPYARGTILGITRGTTAGHIARAAVESMALQSRDLLEAMEKDAGRKLADLKVDGGASANNQLMQFQADILAVRIRRPAVAETTALGAAFLAGLAVGYWQDLDEVANCWQLDREFSPTMSAEERDVHYNRWHLAVERSRRWAVPADA